MAAISRKNHLGRNLKKLFKVYKKEFTFFPLTWLVPTEYHELREFFAKKKKDYMFIVKPEASCQGKGIFLTRRFEDIPNGKPMVV